MSWPDLAYLSKYHKSKMEKNFYGGKDQGELRTCIGVGHEN